MNAVATTIETTPDALALATRELEPAEALALTADIDGFMTRIRTLRTRAQGIVVTGRGQEAEEKAARVTRLALRAERIEATKQIKALKASSLRRGRALDGVAAIVREMIEPVEEYLALQESYTERADAADRDKLRDARRETLTALGSDPAMFSDLGAMGDAAWSATLETAQAAHDAKLEAARQAEAIRLEAERIENERRAAEKAAAIKAEAERQAREKALAEEAAKLRAEAAEREAAAKVERERVEAERAKERAEAEAARVAHEAAEAARIAERKAEQAAIVKAQAEAAQAKADAERAAAEREAADVARAAAEAKSKAPTKARYATLVAALEKIVEIPPDDRYSVELVDHEECQELLVRREGRTILSGNDRGEPEDNAFCRDWSWVPDALAEAYALGHADAAAKAREALAAVGLGKAAES